MALFNHDTSREQEPQLHTHAVVATVTLPNGKWKSLSRGKAGKTGLSETVYDHRIDLWHAPPGKTKKEGYEKRN
ncbi:conjugal transfer protein TraI [Escherichia coli]|nr:conjugal transfer protein TraI [Escherichia coli]